jgi:hypothetical protein
MSGATVPFNETNYSTLFGAVGPLDTRPPLSAKQQGVDGSWPQALHLRVITTAV